MVTLLFFEYKRPKLRFLFYGYIFYLVSLVLQIPLRFVEIFIDLNFGDIFLVSFVFVNIGVIVLSEVLKYFSLRRFLKTKSYKNGIFFGIGWTSIESLRFISERFFNEVFGFFGYNYSVSYFFNYDLMGFVFFFVFNLAICVFIVISIIKRDKFYLFYAILVSVLVYFSLMRLSGVGFYLITGLAFLYSLYVIFRFQRLK